MPSPQYQLLHQAIRVAVKAHKDSDREGDNALPYVTHPIDVVNRLRYSAGVTDEAVLCAGALHDLLEDTNYPPEKILRKFGARVMGLVQEMTRTEPHDEQRLQATPEQLAKIRSELLLSDIKNMSPEAQQIKLADRASNLESALVTRDEVRLGRLIKQTKLILKIIPRALAPNLWDQVRDATLQSD